MGQFNSNVVHNLSDSYSCVTLFVGKESSQMHHTSHIDILYVALSEQVEHSLIVV